MCVRAVRWFAKLKGPGESRGGGRGAVQGEGGVCDERKFG